MCQSSGLSSASCCKEKVYVQDQVCGEFVGSTTLFTNGLGAFVTVSGTISNTSVNEEKVVIINGFRDISFTIPPNSSKSFSAQNFSTIKVEGKGVITGDYCFTIRYRL